MDPGNWATDIAGGSQIWVFIALGFANEQLNGFVTSKFERKTGNRNATRFGASLTRNILKIYQLYSILTG